MKDHRNWILLMCITAIGMAMGAASAKAAGDTPAARRATKALDILEAQGYAPGLQDKSFAGFQNFQPAGTNYEATIQQNGKSFVVIVDPDTGQVTRQR